MLPRCGCNVCRCGTTNRRRSHASPISQQVRQRPPDARRRPRTETISGHPRQIRHERPRRPGSDDLSPEAARPIIGPNLWLGVSTHNPEQIAEADKTDADYLAIGPVFATTSKANPDPVLGLEGVRRARELTRKPLVAIGGITRSNARSVIEAGADSVAVISDLIRDPCKSAEAFFEVLR